MHAIDELEDLRASYAELSASRKALSDAAEHLIIVLDDLGVATMLEDSPWIGRYIGAVNRLDVQL
jgi:hypothetical protein